MTGPTDPPSPPGATASDHVAPGATEASGSAAAGERPVPSVAPEASSPRSAAPSPPAEPRQRWRLTFARDPVPADQVGRAVLDAWQESLAGSRLPVAGLEAGGAGRARIAFAAPLAAAVSGEAELMDLWLLERRPLWAVREALADRLPAAHRWIGAEDVWLGAAPLAGQVAAADWRVEIAAVEATLDVLADAARSLLAARTLPRTRVKGASEKRYDLRPLLADVAVAAEGGGARRASAIVRLRTRFHPELGAGRPEEVVAALGDAVGAALEILAVTRERLVLATVPPPTSAPPRPPIVGRPVPRRR